ncbi:MAG: hypothetical protein HY858_15320 [Candidatus Solibacter usitatus]|nr:hypothetical protein [Candidatus Solibacter usitatus]
MKRLLALMAITALAAFAADITGNWKATAEGPNGAMQRTFAFKQDGAKLTGETVSSMFGKSVINDGKVEGDIVTFTIVVKFQDNEMKVNYKGKVNGDEIKFTVEGAMGGQTIEWLAKREK